LDEAEIEKSAALEGRHWWYAERRALVNRLVRQLEPGKALDVGCGSGGNADVLRSLGWDVAALDYSVASVTLTARRGLNVVRGDATQLPFGSSSVDLYLSTDMWEHVEDHVAVAREAFRVLRPGGRALVAVPCSMSLWSGHDVALGHHRRYEKGELRDLMEGVGFDVRDIMSWNVLLRPVAKLRRRTNESESEMEEVHPLVNAALRATVAAERFLPVQDLPGISIVARAVKPGRLST
jgi:SAM-dependent methyltransferase